MPARPLPAASSHALPDDSLALLAAMGDELACAKKEGRKSSLDGPHLRTRYRSVRDRLVQAGALVSPEAPLWLPGFLFAYDQGFDEYETALGLRGIAAHPQQRYSAEAKRLAAEGFELLTDVRRQAGERLGHSEDLLGLRQQLGIGTPAHPYAPQEVLAVLRTQLAAVTDPTQQPTMIAAGLFPARYAARLAPAAQQLERAIHDGIAGETRAGEAAAERNTALLKIEIALSRAGVWVGEFAGRDAAQKLLAEVPRKLHRKAAKKEAEQVDAAGGSEKKEALAKEVPS